MTQKRKRASSSDDDHDDSKESDSDLDHDTAASLSDPKDSEPLRSRLERERRGSKLLRSAKSGNKWKKTDLDAYNITIKEENEDDFFDLRGRQLPASTVDPTILDNLNMPGGPQIQISDSTRMFFQYFYYATKSFESSKPAESAVDDFSSHLFRSILNYDSLVPPAHGVIRQRMELTLAVCNSNKKAKPNISILREDGKIILVDENKVRLL